MKKLLLSAIIGLLITAPAMAQKYAIVDTRYIFDHMSDYKSVQKSIDDIAAAWQKEIDTKQAALNKQYDDYDAQLEMLSAGAKRKKESELFKSEKELRDLQKKRFGFEGDLFKKRQELMKPLQQKMMDAVKKLIAMNGYDLVLDKSEGNSIIFADQKLDKSDDVIRLLQSK